MKKFKMKNKKKLIINSGLVLTLLISGYSCKKNFSEEELAIKDFYNTLDDIKMSDENDKFYESIYNYKQFNAEEEYYDCNQYFTDYYSTTPTAIAENIIKNTKNAQLSKDCEVIDDIYISSIAIAIENSWDNCPMLKRDSFFHLLKDLKIVESSYADESSYQLISGEYEKETNTIKIYKDNISNTVKNIYQYSDVDKEAIGIEVDNIINETIAHEMNHVTQNTCSCKKGEKRICLNNKTLWEADAEEYNLYPVAYEKERNLYNLTRDIGIFDKDIDINYFHDSLVMNDLSDIYNFFDAKTKEEKYDVYRLFSILNVYPNSYLTIGREETLTEDLYVQLLKYYCKNLALFIDENNIAMEDAIYFFKGYLNELLSLKKNTSPNLDIINKFEIIVNAFEEYLSAVYNVDLDVVSKKMLSIDIYHEILDEDGFVIDTKGHVPTSTLKVLPNQKIKYLSNEYELNGSFLEPVYNENYLESCNFKEANTLLKLIDQQQKLTYKKEK